MHKKNVLNSPRLLELKHKRRKTVVIKFLLSFLVVSILIASLVYGYRIPRLKLATVEVVGSKVVDSEAIKSIAEKNIAGNYLPLLPKANIFFYPKNNIKTELLEQYKRLKDVSFRMEDNNTLVITVSERTGVYTWCGATLPTVNDDKEKCYFMDDSGYIFDEAPFFSGDVYFKFYGRADHTDDSPLGAYFSKNTFKNLTAFKDTLVALHIKPISLFTTVDGDIQVLLNTGATSITKPMIMLKADADFKTVAEKLGTALSTEPLLSDFKNKYSSLEYIDLRYGNKVYYKFK